MRSRLGERGDALLDRLYEAPLEAKGWLAFVLTLERELEGSVAMLCIPAPSNEEPGAIIAPSLDPEFVEQYRRTCFRCDPWLREAGSLPVGDVVVREGWIDGQALAETSFHRDWMRPQGLLPDLLLGGVGDREAQRPPSLITLFQRRGARLADGAAGLLRELMPHLRRALRMHFGGARLEAEREALAAALNHVPLGVIVLDRRSRVRATNRCADRLLARREGLVLDREGLHAARPEDDAHLQRLLADACENRQRLAAGGTLLLERTSGHSPLRASVSRVPSRGDGSATSFAVMFVSDPEAEVELPSEVLGRLHALTSAESALVRELANGRSLREAAARLKITVGTARQRLVQIFEKTGTGRQSELVRLILTGPESLSAEE